MLFMKHYRLPLYAAKVTQLAWSWQHHLIPCNTLSWYTYIKGSRLMVSYSYSMQSSYLQVATPCTGKLQLLHTGTKNCV